MICIIFIDSLADNPTFQVPGDPNLASSDYQEALSQSQGFIPVIDTLDQSQDNKVVSDVPGQSPFNKDVIDVPGKSPDNKLDTDIRRQGNSPLIEIPGLSQESTPVVDVPSDEETAKIIDSPPKSIITDSPPKSNELVDVGETTSNQNALFGHPRLSSPAEVSRESSYKSTTPLHMADDTTANSFRALHDPSSNIRFGILEEDTHSCNARAAPTLGHSGDLDKSGLSKLNLGVNVDKRNVVITERPFAALSADAKDDGPSGLKFSLVSSDWIDLEDPMADVAESNNDPDEDEIIHVSIYHDGAFPQIIWCKQNSIPLLW